MHRQPACPLSCQSQLFVGTVRSCLLSLAKTTMAACLLIAPPSVHWHAPSLIPVTGFYCSVHASEESVQPQESTLTSMDPAAVIRSRSGSASVIGRYPCPPVTSPAPQLCTCTPPARPPSLTSTAVHSFHGLRVQPQERSIL